MVACTYSASTVGGWESRIEIEPGMDNLVTDLVRPCLKIKDKTKQKSGDIVQCESPESSPESSMDLLQASQWVFFLPQSELSPCSVQGDWISV